MQCLTRRLARRALRRHLAGTQTDPSGLRDLLVRHHTDPAAVQVLCDHAEGSFPLLAGVFAAQEQIADAGHYQRELRKAAVRFEQQVDSWLRGQFQNAADTDLLSVFCAARAVFSDEDPFPSMRLSYWFIKSAPLATITDKVVAEMSVWDAEDPSLQLWTARSPKNHKDPLHVGHWLLSRYLYNRFGDDDASWFMFRELYDPKVLPIGALADIVAAVEHP